MGLFKSLNQEGIFVSAPFLGLPWMNLAVSTCLVQLDLTVPGWPESTHRDLDFTQSLSSVLELWIPAQSPGPLHPGHKVKPALECSESSLDNVFSHQSAGKSCFSYLEKFFLIRSSTTHTLGNMFCKCLQAFMFPLLFIVIFRLYLEFYTSLDLNILYIFKIFVFLIHIHNSPCTHP